MIVKTDTYKIIGNIEPKNYLKEWEWANSPEFFYQLKAQCDMYTTASNRPFGFEDEEVTIGPLFAKPDPENSFFENGFDNFNLIAPLQNIFKTLAKLLQETYPEFEGEFKRALVNRIQTGGRIGTHLDSGYHAENTYRIHLCITTNSKCYMVIDDHKLYMKVGQIFEVNNIKPHSVTNGGDEDRVHLIVDWGPKNDTYWSKSSE